MKIIQTDLRIGLEKPFSFLHMSDTHLTQADERDNERKIILAQERIKIFPAAQECLEFATDYAKENDLPICHTGDLLDFVSYANLDLAKNFCRNADVFMAAGNHEFSQYVGEAWEDADYRNQTLPMVQKAFSNDIRFSCREFNGVNFVAVDNGYYLFEEKQLKALKKVVEQGKPVLLFMHTPLYTPEFYDYINPKGTGVAGLMAVPQEKMSHYNDYRYRQQKADETTLAAYKYIIEEKRIKGVFTGHLHCTYENNLSPWAKQFITGCRVLRKVKLY